MVAGVGVGCCGVVWEIIVRWGRSLVSWGQLGLVVVGSWLVRWLVGHYFRALIFVSTYHTMLNG